ncbi:MAG: hypothetical protein HKN92_07005 [Chitinophagales bacterium]|nr:hypothetical protein [Chitinophagales bacterium]
MKITPLFVLLYFVVQSTAAQEKISSTDFLKMQMEKMQNEVMADLYSNIEDEKFKAAFIDDIQIRTETNDFEFRKQQYRLRVSPTSIQLKQTQEKLFEAYKRKYLKEIREIEERYLLTAYEAWIDNYIDAKKIEALRNSLDLKNKMLKDLMAQSENGSYSISDHFKIKRSISNNEFDLLRLEGENSFLQNEYPGLTSVSYDGMKSIAEVKNTVIQTEKSTSQYVNDHDKVIAKYELEEALREKNKVFDYLQGSYSGPHDDIFKERFSLELGIRLPLVGENKLEIYERRFEFEIEEIEQEIERQAYLQESREQREKLKNAIERYEMKQAFIESEAELHSKLKEVQISSGGTWEEYLEMEEVQLANELDLIEAEEEVWERYLEYIEVEEMLQRETKVDYLGKIESEIE